MDTTRSRRSAIVLAGGFLFLPLAACSTDDLSTDTSATAGAEDAAESASSAAESAAGSAADAVDQQVDCSGTSCSVTLSPDAGEVEILGTTMAYDGVEDGEANVRVGDQSVSCTEGQTVEAGPISVECTTVSEESITLTAGLG